MPSSTSSPASTGCQSKETVTKQKRKRDWVRVLAQAVKAENPAKKAWALPVPARVPSPACVSVLLRSLLLRIILPAMKGICHRKERGGARACAAQIAANGVPVNARQHPKSSPLAFLSAGVANPTPLGAKLSKTLIFQKKRFFLTSF